MPTFIEVIVGTVLAFGLGWLWYGPLFGERWCKAQGIKMDKDNCKMPALNMVLTFVGWMATTAVFGWLLALIPHTSPYFAFSLATVLWLAFKLPGHIASVIWTNKDKNLIWIEGFYTWAAMGLIAGTYFLI